LFPCQLIRIENRLIKQTRVLPKNCIFSSKSAVGMQLPNFHLIICQVRKDNKIPTQFQKNKFNVTALITLALTYHLRCDNILEVIFTQHFLLYTDPFYSFIDELYIVSTSNFYFTLFFHFFCIVFIHLDSFNIYKTIA